MIVLCRTLICINPLLHRIVCVCNCNIEHRLVWNSQNDWYKEVLQVIWLLKYSLSFICVLANVYLSRSFLLRLIRAFAASIGSLFAYCSRRAWRWFADSVGSLFALRALCCVVLFSLVLGMLYFYWNVLFIVSLMVCLLDIGLISTFETCYSSILSSYWTVHCSIWIE